MRAGSEWLLRLTLLATSLLARGQQTGVASGESTSPRLVNLLERILQLERQLQEMDQQQQQQLVISESRDRVYRFLQAADDDGEMMISDQANSKPRNPRSLTRRSDESLASQECRAALTLASSDRCLSAERDIEASLNNSFPGTQAAIEQNCGRTSFLLASCWPHQLRNIRELLNSRNKSIQTNTEFPLPVEASQLSVAEEATVRSLAGCPLARIDGQVLDRITWMWLNLCMDQRFRHNYVDHLPCLSLWNLDRAQLVCNNEYRWMKNNLQDRMSSSATLEPKIICCMFDMFLRCVYRQARHDCGRSGAQFVVNFMSRIGTDDLKFICNRELRRWHKASRNGTATTGKQGAGLRRGLFSVGPATERGPFIEGHYCSDPRITDTLRSIQQPVATPDERSGAGATAAATAAAAAAVAKSYLDAGLYLNSQASSVAPEVGGPLMQALLSAAFGLLHLSAGRRVSLEL